jgi:4-hydroxy-tetrahydrodipicolinate reductase
MLNVCVAGITGWTGRAIAAGVIAAPDMELVSAVSRKAAGRDAGEVLDLPRQGVTVSGDLASALDARPADVLIDYTHPGTVMDHLRTALARGVSAVVGTSGLTGDEYATLDAEARTAGLGIVVAGNFSLTAALLNHFALTAARFIEHFEVIDYGKAAKPDAPSGTARELAERLGAQRRPRLDWPLEDLIGPRELRGGTINGVQVHSVRLPGYTASVDALFAVPGSRLVLRHEAGTDASVYVDGTLLAARRAPGLQGVVRGLDRLIFGNLATENER